MLTFGANETISGIENRLKIFERGDLDALHLTANIEAFKPGTEVALFQLILTWAAFSSSKTLVTQVARGINTENSVLNLIQCDYSFVALMAAKVVLGAGEHNITVLASKITNELLKSRTPFIAHDRSRSASLIVSHESLAPPSYAPYLNLAIKGERAERLQAFKRHIEYQLRAFYSATSSVPLFGRTSNLPDILYELFANAEEWGCTNFRKEPVKLPLRGILLRAHRVPKQHSNLNDPLTKFIDGLIQDPDCKYVLEASIFDSGVGLAQRHLKTAIAPSDPIQEELAAVRACLAKRTSSSGNSSRGLGLHHVMDLTSEMKGFLRLRTGRLHLYRDFRQNPYLFAKIEQNKKVLRGQFLENSQFLLDWDTASQTDAVAQAYVKGAVFSLMLPMREAQPEFL